jgi:hypothetical protein
MDTIPPDIWNYIFEFIENPLVINAILPMVCKQWNRVLTNNKCPLALARTEFKKTPLIYSPTNYEAQMDYPMLRMGDERCPHCKDPFDGNDWFINGDDIINHCYSCGQLFGKAIDTVEGTECFNVIDKFRIKGVNGDSEDKYWIAGSPQILNRRDKSLFFCEDGDADKPNEWIELHQTCVCQGNPVLMSDSRGSNTLNNLRESIKKLFNCDHVKPEHVFAIHLKYEKLIEYAYGPRKSELIMSGLTKSEFMSLMGPLYL